LPDPKKELRFFKELPSPEVFDALFDKWAEESLHAADFPAEKPKQRDRIPIIVKRKVAQLCDMKICFPDSHPACFRSLIQKEVKGALTIGSPTAG